MSTKRTAKPKRLTADQRELAMYRRVLRGFGKAYNGGREVTLFDLINGYLRQREQIMDLEWQLARPPSAKRRV